MKRFIYIAAGLVLLLAAAFVALGLLIPEEREFTQVTEIDAPVPTVWQVLTDREKYTEWQDQLSRVEITNENNWVEYPKDVDPLRLAFTNREEERLLEIRYTMDTGLEGSWRGELTPLDSGGTSIRTTDRMVTRNWLMKIMMSAFFDIEEFATDWNMKLKKRCESLR